MAKEVIRIIIADDHPVVISGIKNSLLKTRRIQIVGEVTEGARVFSTVKSLTPDIVLLDLSMPGTTGLQITRKLAKEMPSVKVIAFTMHDDREFILEAVRSGARGYVLKETSTSELVNAIETVFAGQTFFSTPVARILLDEQYAPTGGRRLPTVSMLSERETQILAMIGDGLKTSFIADQLKVSPLTIKTHRQKIMKKLNIHSITELTRFAISRGLSPLQLTK